MAQQHRRTSEILKDVLAQQQSGPIRIGDFVAALGDRAFALAIFIFALPNSLPIPGIPGMSTVTAIPIIYLAWQLLKGEETIRLPYKIANKRFSQDGLAKMINKTLPAIIWLEKYLMPRWPRVLSPMGERGLGLMFIILAAIIALPIPGGNFLPGLSMALIALGMLERDGLFVACACGFALVSLSIMYNIVLLFLQTIFNWIMGLF